MSSNGRSGKAFVTGGSGHLGANLVRALLERGEAVRALEHPDHDNRGLDGLDVERVAGDVRDLDALRRAVDGCARVYHAAAVVSTRYGTPAEKRHLYDVNVLGTRNVLRAARESGVGRVVYTGSLSAVGFDPVDTQAPSDESVPFYPFTLHMPYGYTKLLGEHECLKAAAEGLDVVMATSTGIMGPNDFLPSRLGRTLCDYSNGKLRGYIPGGFEFVSTRDIVAGHLLAMDGGRAGQKYIFSTTFMTVDEMLDHFQAVSGRSKPVRFSPRVMKPLSHVATWFKSRFMPNASHRFTPLAVHILQTRRHADTSKAREELGFAPGDMRQAISEAYEFFVERGQILRQRSSR